MSDLPIVAKLLAFVDDEPLSKPPYDSIREAAAAMQELYEALDACATLMATEALFPPELAALAKARAALSKTRGEA